MDKDSEIDDEDDAWDEDWGDVEGEECTSLFSDTRLPSAAACCDHDSEHHNFDIRQYATQVTCF